jgi:hypothetical protein
MSGFQMHPVTAELLGKAHRADLMADARHARLVREAREARRESGATPTLSVIRVSRRRLATTLAAVALALGVIAGSAGAAGSTNAPAAGPAPAADHGGGISAGSRPYPR